MKKTIIGILLTITSFTVWAQDINNVYDNENYSSKENVLFVEAGGNGILLSMNYERLIKNNIGLRIGVGSLGFFGLTMPAMVNYYIGNERKLELGLGLIYTDYFEIETKESFPNGKFLIVGTIGHKFQRQEGGIVLRFSFTPIYNPVDEKIIPFGGISIGYSFD
jgi:hypothetical protein